MARLCPTIFLLASMPCFLEVRHNSTLTLNNISRAVGCPSWAVGRLGGGRCAGVFVEEQSLDLVRAHACAGHLVHRKPLARACALKASSSAFALVGALGQGDEPEKLSLLVCGLVVVPRPVVM